MELSQGDQEPMEIVSSQNCSCAPYVQFLNYFQIKKTKNRFYYSPILVSIVNRRLQALEFCELWAVMKKQQIIIPDFQPEKKFLQSAIW